MNDIDKVIKALEDADVTYGVIKMSNQFRDVLVALLKEKEQDIQNLIADLDDLRKEHEKLLDKKIPLITSGQEVIRCKDCRFRDDPNSVISEWLPCQFARTPDDWFCACGLTVRENRTVERR